MKAYKIILASAALLSTAACGTMMSAEQERDVATGAVIGAGVGALVAEDGERLDGALIGGATGAVIGGVASN